MYTIDHVKTQWIMQVRTQLPIDRAMKEIRNLRDHPDFCQAADFCIGYHGGYVRWWYTGTRHDAMLQ